METENLLEKISNNFETDPPKMNEEFTLKQNRLYEILESFALIPKNEVKKSEVQENLRNFDIMMNEKKDFNENKENQSQEKKSDPKLDIKVKSKKTKDDIEFEDNSEYLKYLEKYLMYQEEFYNEIMNEQKILINSKNLKMNYMEETKLKIIELEKAMELEQEKTESEVVKYTRIITNLEGEKQNLEKLLEEEFEKHNILLKEFSEKEKGCNLFKEQNETLLREINKEQDILEENKKYTLLLSSKSDELLLRENNLRFSLKENLEKKKFFNNELQELKGNIRVYCRIRPFLQSDPLTERDSNLLITAENNTSLLLNIPPKFIKSENNAKDYKFYFEHTFTEESTQQEIFNELSQLIQSALDGYNVCVFAYGQTGSGKTYTMEGNESEEKKGIIPRGVEYIFQQINYLKTYDWNYNVFVSFQEIYMDQIRDLLKDVPAVNGEVTNFQVDSPENLFPLLKIANQNRKVAETVCNERSSRSHSIFQLKLQGKNHKSGQELNGTLNLIDLAGSERLSVSKAEGERMKETQAINKSLTALGDVITALANKEKHIPYRNSKLTFTLQNYLGGDSKTLMFVNVSPFISNFNQTLCSLRFADKVKKCKIGVAKKHMNNI